jgi:hypothetical protein
MVKTKTALITGASRGIGYDLAKIFAGESYRLVLVSRSEARLQHIRDDFTQKYNVEVIIIVKDLSRPDAALEIFSELRDRQVVVDVLVNNAGIGDFGVFYNEDFQKISSMLHLNIVTLTELTKLFLQGMVERKEGKILNVASMAAYLPGPYMAVYYASKAYVKSFSQAIAAELKGSGVTVTALCPGLTKTGFQKETGGEQTHMARLNLLASSEYVARIAVKAMEEGKEVVVPGLINSSIAMTTRLIPDGVKTRIIRMMQELNRRKIV